MRFGEIKGTEPVAVRRTLPEAIQNAPLDYGTYLRARVRDLDVLKRDFDKACGIIVANEREGIDLLERFLRYGSGESHAYLDDLVRLARADWNGDPRFEKTFPISQLKRDLENILAHGNEFLRFAIESRKYVDALDDQAKQIMTLLHTAEAGAKEYGYDNPPDEFDTEYHAAMGLLKGLRMLSVAVKRDEALWSDISKKLAVVAQKRALAQSGRDYRPEHDEVETLFHASIHAEELARDGFQAVKPEERTGVGNFGTQETISFTHSRKIAQDIARALKEFWMIAHGQITARQIIGWMNAEGIDWKTDSFRSTVGISDRTESEHIPGHYLYRTKDLSELKTPQEIAKLFNVYLWHTKLRGNPVFANIDKLLEQMREIPVKSIGIVQCEVRLTPEDEYLSGESEFRVKPESVLSVKRVQ